MSFVIVPPAVYLIAPAIPFLSGFSNVCLGNVSVLIGCLMLERSASSALGVISELKAKGTLTKTFLGITVASDVVLLILFAITSTFAEAACTDIGFNGNTVVSLIISFAVCIGAGIILGGILLFYLWIPKIPSQLRGALILPTGYALIYLSNYVKAESEEHTGYEIDVRIFICFILIPFLHFFRWSRFFFACSQAV
jgi:Kef-type K+ transport system membrane component KefB